MLKKLTIVLLVLVVALFTLASCGGEFDTENVTPGDSETDAPASETESEAPACNGVDIHDVEVEEVVATCQTRGYRRETCKVCKTVVLEVAYPKTACTPAAPVTCTTDSVCSVCGEVIDVATGHVASANMVQDLGCSAVYACAGEGCSEQITVLKENAQHTVSLSSDYKNLVIKNGQVCGNCSSCGEDVPLPEDVRLSLTFDYATLEEEFAALNNDKISFYTKEVDGKGASAQVKESGDRSVLYFKVANPLFIDYDVSLLADAEVYTISFEYYIARAPYQASTAVSLFTFVPGMKNGSAIAGKSNPWAHTIKFDRTSLYFTDGKSSNPTQYFQPEYGKWYEITLVVDNTHKSSNGVVGRCYVYVDGEFIRTSDCTGCSDDLVNIYGGLSWRIGEMGNTHDPQYDNFKVAVIK